MFSSGMFLNLTLITFTQHCMQYGATLHGATAKHEKRWNLQPWAYVSCTSDAIPRTSFWRPSLTVVGDEVPSIL